MMMFNPFTVFGTPPRSPRPGGAAPAPKIDEKPAPKKIEPVEAKLLTCVLLLVGLISVAIVLALVIGLVAGDFTK